MPQSSLPRTKPKRAKIDVACDTCRLRKIRCDGVRPVCGKCLKKRTGPAECIYSHNGTGPRPSLDQQPRPNDLQTKRRRIDAHPPSSFSPTVSNLHSPSVIDSMTAVVDEGTSTREYFGSSSAGSFTRQIRRAIETKLGTSINTEHQPPSHPPRSTQSHPHPAINDANRVLPTRRQADHLLDMYWTYVDPLYPFLERETWDACYRGIFAGTAIDGEEHVFLATLNVILALATQLDESQAPRQRDGVSAAYFGRAQELVPLNTWEGGSIELVQYLLLTSQYLQSTDHPHQTWMTVGSVVRIAQGLGLHFVETADKAERELYRRVWYGCVLMDRMVSVTHGRPSMISPSLASAVPPPQYPSEVDGDTTDTAFFVKSVDLYEIIHRTIRSLYHGARCDEEPVDLAVVMQLGSALQKWEKGLPERLKGTSTQPRSLVTHRQTVILNLRLLHAWILVLRPLLGSFCLAQPAASTDVSDLLQARVLRECALLCVSTAQDIISTLLRHQTVDGTVGLLPAWWYRVYYVYTAATVLIAAKLRPDVFSRADLGRSWGEAMAVLGRHERFGQSARRCTAALHFLASKMGQEDATEGYEDGNVEQVQCADFVSDLSFDNVDFDANSLSWLNDMHGTWELLNQA